MRVFAAVELPQTHPSPWASHLSIGVAHLVNNHSESRCPAKMTVHELWLLLRGAYSNACRSVGAVPIVRKIDPHAVPPNLKVRRVPEAAEIPDHPNATLLETQWFHVWRGVAGRLGRNVTCRCGRQTECRMP